MFIELFSGLQSLGGSAGFSGLRNQSGGGGGDGRGVLPAVDTELSGPAYRQESPLMYARLIRDCVRYGSDLPRSSARTYPTYIFFHLFPST